MLFLEWNVILYHPFLAHTHTISSAPLSPVHSIQIDLFETFCYVCFAFLDILCISDLNITFVKPSMPPRTLIVMRKVNMPPTLMASSYSSFLLLFHVVLIAATLIPMWPTPLKHGLHFQASLYRIYTMEMAISQSKSTENESNLHFTFFSKKSYRNTLLKLLKQLKNGSE